jgi:hypothetical protein
MKKLANIFSRFRKQTNKNVELFPGKTSEEVRAMMALSHPPRQCHVHYLLCAVRDEDAMAVQSMLKRICIEVQKCNGTVLSIAPPLLLASLGLPGEAAELANKLESLVAKILGAAPRDIKVVYGISWGFYDVIDFVGFGTLAVIIPQMEQRMKRMLDLNYGESLRLD